MTTVERENRTDCSDVRRDLGNVSFITKRIKRTHEWRICRHLSSSYQRTRLVRTFCSGFGFNRIVFHGGTCHGAVMPNWRPLLELEHGICCQRCLIILSLVWKPYSGGLPIIRLSLKKVGLGVGAGGHWWHWCQYISISILIGSTEEKFLSSSFFFFLATLIRSETFLTAPHCASYPL